MGFTREQGVTHRGRVFTCSDRQLIHISILASAHHTEALTTAVRGEGEAAMNNTLVRHRWKVAACGLVWIAGVSTAWAPRAYASCIGDCNTDGSVTVNEILGMIDVALGNAQVVGCSAGDANIDDQITVDEILTAMNAALGGCPTYGGRYSGTVGLSNQRSGTLELGVSGSGQMTGSLVVAAAGGTSSRFSPDLSLPAGTFSIALSGTVDLNNGAFSVSGSFVDADQQTVVVTISGTLPLATTSIPVTGEIGPDPFTSTLGSGPVPPPTATPADTPTAAISTPTDTATAPPASTATPTLSPPTTPTDTATVVANAPTNTVARSATPTPSVTAVSTTVAGGACPAEFTGLSIGSASGAPGEQVVFGVTLCAPSASVGGTQNDISFDPLNIPVAVNAATTGPDCVLGPDVPQAIPSSGFSFPGCSGPTCDRMRAVVLARSASGVVPIAHGTLVYTCRVNIAADAAGGVYPLTISDVVLSTPAGQPIPAASGVSGAITVQGSALSTPTPGTPPTPTSSVGAAPTPTAGTGGSCPDGFTGVSVGSASGAPGQQVTFDVVLCAPTTSVSGMQNDLTFDASKIPFAVNPATSGPDCVLGPTLPPTSLYGFGFPGCSGAACNQMRALVISKTATAIVPIANGTVLYSCRVNIAATAVGTYPLNVSGVQLTTPGGSIVPGAGGISGSIVVHPNGPRTATPTAVQTAALGTPTPTRTPSVYCDVCCQAFLTSEYRADCDPNGDGQLTMADMATVGCSCAGY